MSAHSEPPNEWWSHIEPPKSSGWHSLWSGWVTVWRNPAALKCSSQSAGGGWWWAKILIFWTLRESGRGSIGNNTTHISFSYLWLLETMSEITHSHSPPYCPGNTKLRTMYFVNLLCIKMTVALMKYATSTSSRQSGFGTGSCLIKHSCQGVCFHLSVAFIKWASTTIHPW